MVQSGKRTEPDQETGPPTGRESFIKNETGSPCIAGYNGRQIIGYVPVKDIAGSKRSFFPILFLMDIHPGMQNKNPDENHRTILTCPGLFPGGHNILPGHKLLLDLPP